MVEFKNLSDQELIDIVVKDGNTRYFSILYEKHRHNIYTKCFSYVKNREAAEDLTQEILIKVFMNLNKFREECKFTTWLYAIIFHTCIDYLRKNRKNVHQILSEKLIDELEDEIESEEEVTLEMLENLLTQLNPDEKLILMLKYKEKQSIREIQGVMGLSESAIKMRLSRARDHLMKLFSSGK